MASKEDIRSSHRARRAALRRPPGRMPPLQASPGTGSRGLPGLPAAGPGTFAAYLGVGSEPPTLPLLSALHGAGHRVLLPVCEPGT